MLLSGADVEYRGGEVTSSGGTGVFVQGNDGNLLLEEVAVQGNAAGASMATEPVHGAGLGIACDAGTVRMDRARFDNNAKAGIAIGGSRSRLEMDGGWIRTQSGIGLALQDGSAASVYLRDTTIRDCSFGILARDFQVLNGGDNGTIWGRNYLHNSPSTEVRDARPSPAAGVHPRMTFSGTYFHAFTANPQAGVVYWDAGTLAGYGIVIDNPGNEIEFF